MIEESKPEVKGDEDAIIEEEFDIVPIGQKSKTRLKSHFLNVSLVSLVALAAFGLGRITTYEEKRVPIQINTPAKTLAETSSSQEGQVVDGEVKGVSSVNEDASGEVVASKSGTKYHYPWCAGAKQILEKNRIVFNSIEEARKAGYTPAANCKGLK